MSVVAVIWDCCPSVNATWCSPLSRRVVHDLPSTQCTEHRRSCGSHERLINTFKFIQLGNKQQANRPFNGGQKALNKGATFLYWRHRGSSEFQFFAATTTIQGWKIFFGNVELVEHNTVCFRVKYHTWIESGWHWCNYT